jgi:hypothetical protein
VAADKAAVAGPRWRRCGENARAERLSGHTHAVRTQVNSNQLTGLSALLADDARALDEVTVPRPEPDEVGDPRLAEALDHFQDCAGIGIANLAQAATALAQWMLLAAEVAEADDAAFVTQFHAQHVSVAPTRNPGAQAASLSGR